MAGNTPDHEWLGHAFTIDRCGSRKLPLRTITVPSLLIVRQVAGTYKNAVVAARALIDEHIAEHGDAPAEKTDAERAETRNEVYGRF